MFPKNPQESAVLFFGGDELADGAASRVVGGFDVVDNDSVKEAAACGSGRTTNRPPLVWGSKRISRFALSAPALDEALFKII